MSHKGVFRVGSTENTMSRLCFIWRDGAQRTSNSSITTESELIEPIHLGEILMVDFFEGFGITQNKLAVSIGAPPRRINEFVHGKRGIAADTALRLARCFRTSEEVWMNLQSNYELRLERREEDQPVLNPAISVRQYRADDARATLDVFHQAIRRTAARFYDRSQIDAWARGGDVDLTEWNVRREQAWTVVAELEVRVVGFSDLVDEHLLDMLFVHPDAGGRGVARALVSAVLDRAAGRGVSRVVTHASRAARPALESFGFVVVQENPDNLVRGVVVPNCEMRLRIPQGDDIARSSGFE